MSRPTHRQRTHRVALDPDTVASLAATLVGEHAMHLESGYRLMGSSAVWRKKDGRYTARFVYRAAHRTAPFDTISYTIRELRES